MKIKINLGFLIFLAFISLLLGYRTEHSSAYSPYVHNDTLERIKKIFGVALTDALGSEEYGRKVKFDSVEECLEKYDTIMKHYGFEDSANTTSINRYQPTRRITRIVSFRGKELFNWIISIPRPSGISDSLIELRVLNGIYTDDFLATYFSTQSDFLKRRERHTVFLMPYIINTNTKIGDYAFDLGGLKP